MQIISLVRQTHRRYVAIAGQKTRFVAEHASVLTEDINVDLAANPKAGFKARPKAGFVDKVVYSFEKEDTMAERLVGYGVCALAVLYLLGSLLRAVLNMVAVPG